MTFAVIDYHPRNMHGIFPPNYVVGNESLRVTYASEEEFRTHIFAVLAARDAKLLRYAEELGGVVRK